MCIHGGLFVCFRKECSAAQLLAYASRRLLSMPIVVVQSCFLPLIFFFISECLFLLPTTKLGGLIYPAFVLCTRSSERKANKN